ncbi:nucleotidyltransferase domain-containing protein [Actinopolymorpha pittospori]|uniref:Nucleotidyltransferase n=1 Tax=Actinopolymorpha pittospori TaxID=648752 RepID=A0A927N4L1_9ACTN|nr:nucleotidyltransferase domain-containing protein [Actinopolymorpha pittospori]MBE1611994.1 putative nucleotidyltransferase [Actinopolymorpha pittospori]
MSQPPESSTDLDPRLRDWENRLARRAEEAVEALGAVPGVAGLVVGGSLGRGEHWPLSDIDIMVVCSGRSVEETAAEVDLRAYQLSEMWGVSGIYTGVDAGRLTFDEADVLSAASEGRTAVRERMSDPRWLHGVDKIHGGFARRDPRGVAQAFLDWSSRSRFEPGVVDARIAGWFEQARQATTQAERLLVTGDPTGAWISIRRAGTALAEVATERWGQRAGSLGRYWTLFEARAKQHGDPAVAEGILRAVHAEADEFSAVPHSTPEWLEDRIALSYSARRLAGEDVTPAQNVRDNLLAFASLYRGRFPSARQTWMGPEAGVDPRASIRELSALTDDLRDLA